MSSRPSLLGVALLVPALSWAASPVPGGSQGTPSPTSQAVKGQASETQPSVSSPAVAPPMKPVAPADAKAATEAATAYLNGLRDGGLAAAPAHLHPQALERFKTFVLPRLELDQARGSRTLLNATFGREATIATARDADPADFMARFIRVVNARDPDVAPRFVSATPLGVVAEGDELHVLFRLGGGPGDGAGRLEVVSLRPQGKAWKVLLDGRLEAVARSLGGQGRGDRRTPPRMEPMPEGVAPQPLGPLAPGVPPAMPGPPVGPLPPR